MPAPFISTGSATTTAGGVLQSIRAQIPDPVAVGQPQSADGNAFSFSTLILWINDALKILCTAAPVINDWYAIASEQAMDVYVLPGEIQQVTQLWYDNWPCWRSPELDALFVTKVTSRSYFFGPHSIHAVPRLHVWPACNRTSAVTTLSSGIDEAVRTIPLTSVADFRTYGFVRVENELILYRTVNASPTNTLTQTLRGQGGTVATPHSAGAPAIECNIMFRCSKLAAPVTGIDDLIEIPVGLVPLLETYVLSQVREAEQEHAVAQALGREFSQHVDQLANRVQLKGLTQGLQVRSAPPGPWLAGGRVYIP